MKTKIYDVNARRGSVKNMLKLVFSFVLVFTLIFAVPGGFLVAHAAPLEDCDLDGYDDATGAPVPWPGFDGTKGDQLPAGWGGTGGTASSKAGGTTSSKADGTTSSKAGGTTTGKTGGTTTGKTGGTTTGKTGGTTTGKTGGTTTGKTGGTTTGKTGGTTSAPVNSTAPDQTNGQSEAPQSGGEQTSGSPDTQGTDSSAAAADVEAVVNTKGSLKIKEANGSAIHAGSSVILSGSGFTGNVADLEIEIQSEPRRLGTVASSEDGSFEAKINIPDDLEAGTHHIVVLYQGTEITRQQIEVGPKAANSFLQALSVGFTKSNEGLAPGLFILAGLFALGLVTLLVNMLIGSLRHKKLSEKRSA